MKWYQFGGFLLISILITFIWVMVVVVAPCIDNFGKCPLD
jgi:hypothetical protein